ncbi:unnamed protein product [Leuciscus chuanchicus]
MSNISVCCGEIESAVGFVCVILHVILNHTLNEDFSSDRLVTSRCVNVLHEILCDASGSHHSLKTMFRDIYKTNYISCLTTTETPESLWWLFALFIFIIFILICFMLRKRIFMYFPKAETIIFQRNDPENRDPESDDDSLKKLKSDESDSLQFNMSTG